jgi:alkylhydroperoxidase/carboxymuconolactone decarboxylase family protein YurZ
MKDIHKAYTVFKSEFPELAGQIDTTSHALRVDGGPLDERTCALVKLAAAAASGHQRAVETHLASAREAGVPEAEIKHALLLLITTCGFPTFMEAYSICKGV